MSDTAGAAELALEQWQFNGQRLLRLAARVAHDHRNLPVGYLEDAISHLTEVGIRAAFEFNPDRALGFTYGSIDKHFEAFAYYRMRLRLIDWVRTTSNGNGFGRNGTLGRELLVSDTDPGDHESPATMKWHGIHPEDLDGLDDVVIADLERERWRKCAKMSGLSLTEWLYRAGTIQADFQLAS